MSTRPKTLCAKHPLLNIEALCFHPQCRQKRQQLVCIQCSSEEGHHSTHHQYIEPIHLISQTLKQLTSSEASNLQELLLSQLQETSEYLDEIKGRILGDFSKWKQKQMTRLFCLAKLLDYSSFQSIFDRLSNQEQIHSTCCMHLINFLYDSTKSSHLSPDLIKNTVAEQVSTNYRALLLKANNLKQIVQEMLESKDYDLLCITNNEVKLQIQAKTTVINQTIKSSFRRYLNSNRTNLQDIEAFSRQKDWGSLQKSIESNFLHEETADKSEQSYFEHVYSSFKKKIPEIVPLGQEQISTDQQVGDYQRRPSPKTSTHKNKSQMIHKGTIRTRRSYGKKEFPIEIQEQQGEVKEFNKKNLRKQATAEVNVRQTTNNDQNVPLQPPQIILIHKEEVRCRDKANPEEIRRRSQRLKKLDKINYLDNQTLPYPQECTKGPVQTFASEKIYKKGEILQRGSSRVQSIRKGSINSSFKARQK